jgi:hypothetical protein
MAIARSETEETLSLAEQPADEPRPDAAGSSVLDRLRAAWSDYLAENRRGWGEIVDDQAKNPSLD